MLSGHLKTDDGNFFLRVQLFSIFSLLVGLTTEN